MLKKLGLVALVTLIFGLGPLVYVVWTLNTKVIVAFLLLGGVPAILAGLFHGAVLLVMLEKTRVFDAARWSRNALIGAPLGAANAALSVAVIGLVIGKGWSMYLGVYLVAGLVAGAVCGAISTPLGIKLYTRNGGLTVGG